MDSLGVCAVSLPVESLVSDPVGVVAGLVEKIKQQKNCDVFLFPEYMWAALAHGIGDEQKGFTETSRYLWGKVIPELMAQLPSTGLYILGTGPYHDGQALFNRCPIIMDRELVEQDKIFLTPWETQFQGGKSPKVYTYRGVRFAVLVCLDIEIPDLAVYLKKQDIEMVFVPSATEGLNGWQRISRCASARSVELGAGVAVAHLRGGLPETVDLVSENVGSTGFFLPSQSFFEEPRQVIGKPEAMGLHWDYYAFPIEAIRAAKKSDETNPAALGSWPS